jgi:type IV secretory pathway VirB2 component (pilin)
MSQRSRSLKRALGVLLGLTLWVPLSWAQATPFDAGVEALSTDILAIMASIAILVVIGLGVMAWFGQLTWSAAIRTMAGIVLVFGAVQVVDWARGMFGV